MSQTILDTARAEALFVSEIPRTGDPVDRATVSAAITLAVRAHGGVHGCACDVAYEFGRHPETAVPRMRWALATVRTVYAGRPCSCGAPKLRLHRQTLTAA